MQAYVRDAVSAKEYEAACLNLIAKFKTLRSALRDNGVPDVEHFMSAYSMECPAAVQRLIHSGVPATIEHGQARNDAESAVASVAETVQHFITTMDGLKLNLSAVDQLFPYLTDLVAALHKVPQLPPDFEGKVKLKEWMRQVRLDENEEPSYRGSQPPLSKRLSRPVHARVTLVGLSRLGSLDETMPVETLKTEWTVNPCR